MPEPDVLLGTLDLDERRKHLTDLVGHLGQPVDVLFQRSAVRRDGTRSANSSASSSNRPYSRASDAVDMVKALTTAGHTRENVFQTLQGAEVPLGASLGA